MATIDALNLKISSSASDAAKGIRSLSAALTTLQKKIDDGKIKSLAQTFEDLDSSVSKVSDSNIRKLERLSMALQRMSRVNVSSGMKKISKATAEAVDSVNESIPATSDSSGLGTGESKRAVDDATNMTTATEKARTATDRFKTLTDKFAKSMVKLKEGFSKATISVTKFIRALGRVAFYRAVRGLISSITQGLKVGIQNIAMYSKAINGLDSSNAYSVMSAYKTLFTQIKNGLGTVVMPILAALLPTVQNLTTKFLDLADAMAKVLNAFNGKDIATVVNRDYWEEYADSLDTASGSAKKLNKQLAAFDELNNLTTTEGSGSGSKMPNYDDMFDKVEIDPKYVEFAEKLRDIFDKIKENVGLIGTALAAWAISSTLARALQGLNLLSGLGAIGLTIGMTLAITGIAIEADAFKKALEEGINLDNLKEHLTGMITTILGSTLTGGIIGVIIKGLSFGVGAAWGGGIAAAVTGAIGLVIGFIDIVKRGLNSLNQIWTEISSMIGFAGVGLIVGMVIGNGLGPIFAAVGAVFGLLMGSFLEFIATFIHEIRTNGDEIKAKCSEVFQKIKDIALKVSISLGAIITKTTDLKTGFSTMWLSIRDDLQFIKEAFNEFLNSPVVKALKEFFQLLTIGFNIRKLAETPYSIFKNINMDTNSINYDVGSLRMDKVDSSVSLADSISESLYNATTRALRENQNTVVVSADTDKIFKVTQQKANQYTARTGKSAFSY